MSRALLTVSLAAPELPAQVVRRLVALVKLGFIPSQEAGLVQHAVWAHTHQQRVQHRLPLA